MTSELAKFIQSVVTAHNALQAARSIGRDEAYEAVDNLTDEAFTLLAAIIGNDDASAVFLHYGDASGDAHYFRELAKSQCAGCGKRLDPSVESFRREKWEPVDEMKSVHVGTDYFCPDCSPEPLTLES